VPPFNERPVGRREKLFAGLMCASLAVVCAVLGAFIVLWCSLGVSCAAGGRGTEFAIFVGMPVGALLGGVAGFAQDASDPNLPALQSRQINRPRTSWPTPRRSARVEHITLPSICEYAKFLIFSPDVVCPSVW
jgi:hypothetical protein